jgi:hypothetical protein
MTHQTQKSRSPRAAPLYAYPASHTGVTAASNYPYVMLPYNQLYRLQENPGFYIEVAQQVYLHIGDFGTHGFAFTMIIHDLELAQAQLMRNNSGAQYRLRRIHLGMLEYNLGQNFIIHIYNADLLAKCIFHP